MKGKGIFHPRIGHEVRGGGEEVYTLSLTSALVGVHGQSHAPSALSPGKTRYPFYSRLGGPKGRS